MKNIFRLAWLAFFLGACTSSGFRPMNDRWHELPDGSKLNAFQGKNSGISGTDVTVIETWRCPKDSDCSKAGAYSGATPGAVEVMVAGAVAAGLGAAGNVGAAALLPGTQTFLVNKQGQKQGQKQEQEQEQGQKPPCRWCSHH